MWRMECQLKNIQLYEEKFNDSTDRHWQNVRKYSQSNHVKLTAKDLKPAEGSVQFLDAILKEISFFIAHSKNQKSFLYNKELSVPGWKANELRFMEQIIYESTKVESFFSKTRGDTFDTFQYLARRVGTVAAEQSEKSPAKKRRAENKRTSVKRKEKRHLKSAAECLSIISGEEGQDIIKMVGENNFKF